MVNFNYFNPARTQPFIITFFMAVLAFRRLWKRMRQARQLRNRQLFPSHSRSMLQAVMKRSQRNIYTVLKGKSVMNPRDVVSASSSTILPSAAQQQIKARASVVYPPRRSTKIISKKRQTEELFRNVSRQVASFHMKLHQNRAEELEERLDNIIAFDKKEEIEASIPSPKKSHLQSRSKASSRSALRNTYFQQFAAAPLVADELDEHNTHQLDVGEYLEGTSIYYGATIALQVSFTEVLR